MCKNLSSTLLANLAAFTSTCPEFLMLFNPRSFFTSRRGLTLVEILIVAAIVGTLLLVVAQAIGSANFINIPRSIFLREDVIGEVTALPASKLQLVEGTETKFSINLTTAEGPVIVNCTSTQCASLQVGQNVALSCYEEFHFAEPNETECRFDKLVPN